MDDCFSGLDANTEDTVFDNLLSQEGILRKANMTIVLASSDCEYIAFHLAVQIMDGFDGFIRLLTLSCRSSRPICRSNYLTK